MANDYRLRVGRPVSYLKASGRWTAARITAITSQTAVKLAYSRTSPTDATNVAINSNLDVNMYTRTAGVTNVWRSY